MKIIIGKLIFVKVIIEVKLFVSIHLLIIIQIIWRWEFLASFLVVSFFVCVWTPVVFSLFLLGWLLVIPVGASV